MAAEWIDSGPTCTSTWSARSGPALQKGGLCSSSVVESSLHAACTRADNTDSSCPLQHGHRQHRRHFSTVTKKCIEWSTARPSLHTLRLGLHITSAMSKKRGLSIDEKKQKVLEIFHESKDVFVLKDIEKLAPKRGVTLQSVKEVIQALVDDDLVHQDKIGASNFFWSFPSEAAVKLKTEAKRKEQELADLEKLDVSLSAQIEESKKGKEESDDRKAKLEQMEELQESLSRAQKEMAQYADSDPTKVEAMRVGAEIARSAANRWLDNTWALESWCKKRFEGMEETLGSFFKENGLTDDLEYIM